MSTDGLAGKIARRIRAEGPLSVAAFMTMALYDPEGGYYMTGRPIGAAGDFVTAPEVSQIFGELIGVWCALVWERMGQPPAVAVGGLGPGRGTLAADLLRAARVAPEFHRAIRLHLIEISPALRAVQQQRLASADAVWLARVEDLPEGPLILLANEFLDALPIRQLVRRPGGWVERLVGLDQQDRLVFTLGPPNPTLGLLVPAALRETAPIDGVFEICPAAATLAATLAARLARSPGAALFIDYGCRESGLGASLRAFRDHAPVDPLAAPGTADLSAGVDFAAIAETAAAAGARACGPVPQGAFLRQLGAAARLERLCRHAPAAQREALASGAKRLLDPEQMGSLYQVLALTSGDWGMPPGFEGWQPTR